MSDSFTIVGTSFHLSSYIPVQHPLAKQIYLA